MTIKFQATHCHSETNHEDGIHILGLSNGESEYDNYVLFQRSFDFDKQDIELGMDTYHFEVNGREYSNYGACKKVTLDKCSLKIAIDSEKIYGIDNVEIDISSLILEKNFIDKLKQILKGKADLQILA